MNVLITGGCGFIGSNLAKACRRYGWEVTCIDNLSRRGSEIMVNMVLEHECRFVHGDIRMPEDLEKLKEDYAFLVECSAEPSVLAGTHGRDARYVLNVNLQGSINCFEWARERQLPVIFLSTSRVYPYDRLNACSFRETETRFELEKGCVGISTRGVNLDMPMKGVRSLYGTSKLCSELILQEYAAQYGLPAIINRCGVVTGPWQMGKVDQGVFTFWLANHYFKKSLNYIGFGGKGKQVRDLLHVDDLVRLIMKQAELLMDDPSRWRGEVFNAGGSSYSNLSLMETTEICAELTGNSLNIGSVTENRPSDVIWYITDNGSTESTFSWKLRKTARDTLQDTFNWLRDNEAEFRRVFE